MCGWRRQEVMVPGRDVDKAIHDSATRIEVEFHHLIALGSQSLGEFNKVAFLIQNGWPIIESLSIFESELCRMDSDAAGLQGAQRVFHKIEAIGEAPEMLEYASRPAKIELTVKIAREGIHIDRPKIDVREKLLIGTDIAAAESLD
jgi:hypothetical protein